MYAIYTNKTGRIYNSREQSSIHNFIAYWFTVIDIMFIKPIRSHGYKHINTTTQYKF